MNPKWLHTTCKKGDKVNRGKKKEIQSMRQHGGRRRKSERKEEREREIDKGKTSVPASINFIGSYCMMTNKNITKPFDVYDEKGRMSCARVRDDDEKSSKNAMQCDGGGLMVECDAKLRRW